MKLCQKYKLENDSLTNFDKFYVASLLFYIFLLPAEIIVAQSSRVYLLWYFGARFMIAGVLMAFMLQQTMRGQSIKVNKGLLVMSYMFVLLAFLPSIHHQTTFILLRAFIDFYLPYMFFLFYKKKYLSPLVNVATAFMFAMLVLAIIGFAYAFLGGPPIMTIFSRDGREYFWYLTTGAVTGGIIGNIIRPSGIYLEPSGLSFFTCVICFLRVFAKKNDVVTFGLFLLGMVTFSMTHMILFALFILHLAVKYITNKKLVLYVGAALLMTVAIYLPFREVVDEYLAFRFAVDERTGQRQGDTRTNLVDNALGLLKSDYSFFFWGVPRDANGLSVLDREWGYGQNPVEPVLKYGIFIAWLYYFYLAFFLLCAIIDRKRFFIYLSILLIFLPRPVFYKGAYVASILILFCASSDLLKQRIKKIISVYRNPIPNKCVIRHNIPIENHKTKGDTNV